LDRVISKKWKMVRELGCESDCIRSEDKPKWMHWKTFDHIWEQIQHQNETFYVVMSRKFG
jgi:hypothetical protein